MRTDKYFIKDFFSFASLEQLVIPEMQRDYVWEEEQILDLLLTFQEGFHSTEEDKPYLGFIYAYTDKDHPYKYFVVDGQQRLTSIYIILLVCYQMLDKQIPSYLFTDRKLKLDYKVRQSTHDFLLNLISHCQLNLKDHDFLIEQQRWFHISYKNDKTISNIIENFYTVRTAIKEFGLENIPAFVKYIENKIQFSYFDIENGREGEELYIYMNARGKQLEANETLKAKYLGKIKEEERAAWGLKWEQWQDFFWKHKGENLDADTGFDEFLRRVQILNMCLVGKSNDQVSNFSSGRSESKITAEFLPESIKELEEYFEAFKMLIELETLREFYNKYESSNDYLTETPYASKRQVYYLITLPILALVKGNNFLDSKTVCRFARFFYNISRKTNVGKDISTQLPAAIKLIQDYTSSKPSSFDVTGLKNHRRGRALLLDEEELFKLKNLENPPSATTREEVEEMFWSAEDHDIFNGEISFLLENGDEDPIYELEIDRFRKLWSAFQILFPISKTKSNNSNIIRALLFYGNTWVQDSPYYYRNFDCADWSLLVKLKSGKYLKALLNDMENKPATYLDKIIAFKISEYFIANNLLSLETIKSTEGFFEQVKILASLDYYYQKVLWTNHHFYFAEDDRFVLDRSFFTKNRLFYNIQRYHYNDSSKIVYNLMIDLLPYDSKIEATIEKILAG